MITPPPVASRLRQRRPADVERAVEVHARRRGRTPRVSPRGSRRSGRCRRCCRRCRCRPASSIGAVDRCVPRRRSRSRRTRHGQRRAARVGDRRGRVVGARRDRGRRPRRPRRRAAGAVARPIPDPAPGDEGDLPAETLSRSSCRRLRRSTRRSFLSTLPRRVAGQRVDELELLGDLVRRQVGARVRYAVISSNVIGSPGRADDHGARPLAAVGVGQADDGGVGDRRMGVQQVLDLLGRDVLALADDDVLEPAR